MNVMRNKIFVSVFLLFAFFAVAENADAAVLRMGPTQTDVTVGNIVKVQVSVDTLGRVINNAESAIQFPTDLLEVVLIDSTSSIFSLWVENPSFSNATGLVTFNGGVPNPGFQGTGGKVISVVFRAKKEGTASVVFSNSAVRENDGLGTDILSGKIGSEITIRSARTEPVTDSLFVLTSSSHPNQNVWYSEDDIEMSWTLPRAATAIKTLLGAYPDSEPTVYYDTPITAKSIPNMEDGVWYFHVQYFDGGAKSKTQHYRLKIDTTDPTDLSVTSGKDNTGKVTLHMKASDSLSGIDHFTVEVNSGKPIVVTADVSGEASVEVPFTRKGEHGVTVSAFDKAGNNIETDLTVIADYVPELRIDEYPATVMVNESIEMSGTAPYPDALLRVSMRDDNNVVQVYKLKSNSYSEFDFISQAVSNEGSYTLWVDMLKDNGDIILTSQRVVTLVETPLLLRIGSYTIGLMKVLIPATILLILFLLLLLYGWFKFFALYRRVKKESREAEEVSARTFKVLRRGVDRHIKKLKKAKRKLTKEEAAFLKEFSEKLEEGEKVVKKEIQDISKL
ncbi:hypothetical protein COB55_03485 [Candidatus Wolfebacteria bacterium]|nr:MAG: hypothetical protein COB55_03485 [Candidatus Wolfebacteria bacterium]